MSAYRKSILDMFRLKITFPILLGVKEGRTVLRLLSCKKKRNCLGPKITKNKNGRTVRFDFQSNKGGTVLALETKEMNFHARFQDPTHKNSYLCSLKFEESSNRII